MGVKLQYIEPWTSQSMAHERAAAAASKMLAACDHVRPTFPCVLCVLEAFLKYERAIDALRWAEGGPWSEFNRNIASRTAGTTHSEGA